MQSYLPTFDLGEKAQYKLFPLSSPERIVVDLKNGKLGNEFSLPDLKGTPIQSIRNGNWDKTTLRFVLDLRKKKYTRDYTLLPNKIFSDRLVIDLTDKKRSLKPLTADEKEATPPEAVEAKPQPPVQPVKTIKPRHRDIIIAIDAGHGGRDSGAVGKRGTLEKDITLKVARKLAKLVNDEPGMRAYLTRNKDEFIPLRHRIKRAHDNRADMFISIHADAFKNKQAKGASVYVLSERGASSEAAKLLADKENAADLAGGISLEDKDHDLAKVLLDLSQTASLEGSLEVANTVLSGLKRVGAVHKKQVESAAFVVLKSPDIPSILVETAFISNPDEEKKLRSARHQHKLAKAMLAGIRNYFERNPLPEPIKPQQHIVERGDTLSGIAQRYQVSMADLKSSNKISGSNIKIGQKLRIP